MPIIKSPSEIFEPSIIFSRSTAPTQNPARSYSSFEYIPGISAVSPPTNEQPANLQPSDIPFITSVALLIFSFPHAK